MAISLNDSEKEEGEIAESPAGPGLGFGADERAEALEPPGSDGPEAAPSEPQPATPVYALRVPEHRRGTFFWALRGQAAATATLYPTAAVSYPPASNIAWAQACQAESDAKSEYSTASEGSAWREDGSPGKMEETEDPSPSKQREGREALEDNKSPLRTASGAHAREGSEKSDDEDKGPCGAAADEEGGKEEGELEEGEIVDEDLDGDADAALRQESAPETTSEPAPKRSPKDAVRSESFDRKASKSRHESPRQRSRTVRERRSPKVRERPRSRSPKRRRSLSRSPKRRRSLSRSPKRRRSLSRSPKRRHRTRSRSRERADRWRRERSRERKRSPERSGGRKQRGRGESKDRSPSKDQVGRKKRDKSVDSAGAIADEFRDRVGRLGREAVLAGSPRSGGGSAEVRGDKGGGQKEQLQLLQKVEALVAKVSVQQAVKSLASVCCDLEDAIGHLCKAARIKGEVQREAVGKAADDVFFGIRTVYIIGTTGAGRNQGKDDAVLSLLKLAHKDMVQLLSTKQYKEVETWLEQLTRKASKSPPVTAAEKPKAATAPLPTPKAAAATSSQQPPTAPNSVAKPPPTNQVPNEPAPSKASVRKMSPSLISPATNLQQLPPDLDALRKNAQAYAQGKLQQAAPPLTPEHAPPTPPLIPTATVFSAGMPVDPLQPPGFAQPFPPLAGPPGFNAATAQMPPQPHAQSQSTQPASHPELMGEAFSDEEGQPAAGSPFGQGANSAPPHGVDLPPGFRFGERQPHVLQGAPLSFPWGSEAAQDAKRHPDRLLPNLQLRPAAQAGGGEAPTVALELRPPLPDDNDDLPEAVLDPPGFAPAAAPASALGSFWKLLGKGGAQQAAAKGPPKLLSLFERPQPVTDASQEGAQGESNKSQEKPPGFEGGEEKKQGTISETDSARPDQSKGAQKTEGKQAKGGETLNAGGDTAAATGKRPRASTEDSEETTRGAKRSNTAGGGKGEQPAVGKAGRSEMDKELVRRLKDVQTAQSKVEGPSKEGERKGGEGQGERKDEGGNGAPRGSLPEKGKQGEKEVISGVKTSRDSGEDRQPSKEAGRPEKEGGKVRSVEKRGESRGGNTKDGRERADAQKEAAGVEAERRGGEARRDPPRHDRRGEERRGLLDGETHRREGDSRRGKAESPREKFWDGLAESASPRGSDRRGSRSESRRDEYRSEMRRDESRTEQRRRDDYRRGFDRRRDERDGRPSSRGGLSPRQEARPEELSRKGAKKDRPLGAEEQGRPKDGSWEELGKTEEERPSAVGKPTPSKAADESAHVEARPTSAVAADTSRRGKTATAQSAASGPVSAVLMSSSLGKTPELEALSRHIEGLSHGRALLQAGAGIPSAEINLTVTPNNGSAAEPSLEHSLRGPSPAASRSGSPTPAREASPAVSDSRVVNAQKPAPQGARTEPSNLGRPPRAPSARETAQNAKENGAVGERGSRAGESVQESGQSRNSAAALSTADSVESELLGVLLSGPESSEGKRDGLERQGSGRARTSELARPSEKAAAESNAGAALEGLVESAGGAKDALVKRGSFVARVPNDKGLNGCQVAISGDPHVDALLSELGEEERAAVELERARRLGEQERMLAARKLCLVLDLDHTLLNSATVSDLGKAGPEWVKKLEAKLAAEDAACRAHPGRHRELYFFPDMQMWTKLRPGVAAFLKQASRLFELHVYTMGNSAYATRMAHILDPTGAYFAGRIISKGDALEAPLAIPGELPQPLRSKDLDGVLGMESCVLIIDDNSKVWPHHFHNLIVAERYMYFPGSLQQFGQSGRSLFEQGHDERAHDGMLASASRVIQQVHGDFFRALQEQGNSAPVDARDMLQRIQRSILQGVRIVFSRVFPLGTPHVEQNAKWRMAEQFGATCTLTLDDSVTHVVATAMGTDKVLWALKNKRHVVNPHWLEASAILYKRANEANFPISPSMQQS